jgi:hypothetical protein
VEELLTEFEIQRHTTTPSDGKGTWYVTEHLNLLELGRGITGPEAIMRPVLANNHSIHSVTGKMPIELMREWQRENHEVPIDQELGRIRLERGKGRKIGYKGQMKKVVGKSLAG